MGDYLLAVPGHICPTTIRYPGIHVVDSSGKVVDYYVHYYVHMARDRGHLQRNRRFSVVRSCDWVRMLLLTLAISPCVVYSESPTSGREVFEDRAEASGVDFVHFAGVSGEFYIVEISGPGCGLLDYDNDGD
ncbi:MAG: hypothetical protein GY722_27630, partial [bacterium]|nr:hypothetical protein [bacterium]